ncbi:MAG TPA: hypothetical protein DCZ49_02860 [Hyphomonadaceae bacterium]|nr:hypothetical protein [Hyphomonadaceae bacterium]
MKILSAEEADQRFADLLDAVERGETIHITRKGRTIAELRPLRLLRNWRKIGQARVQRKCARPWSAWRKYRPISPGVYRAQRRRLLGRSSKPTRKMTRMTKARCGNIIPHASFSSFSRACATLSAAEGLARRASSRAIATASNICAKSASGARYSASKAAKAASRLENPPSAAIRRKIAALSPDKEIVNSLIQQNLTANRSHGKRGRCPHHPKDPPHDPNAPNLARWRLSLRRGAV